MLLYILPHIMLLLAEVKSGEFDTFALTDTHIKARDTPSFLQELIPEDFTLVYTPRVNKDSDGVGFSASFFCFRVPQFKYF